MPCAEPGPSVGTWLQAGPKMSLILVTPAPVGAVASPAGAAEPLAGAEASLPVAGPCALLQAPTTAVRAAIAPTAASRWIFLIRFSSLDLCYLPARLVRASHGLVRQLAAKGSLLEITNTTRLCSTGTFSLLQ